jgi:apolipoprotein N-acyltransferase
MITVDFVLKWTACAVTLVGALLTSLAIDPMNIWLLNLGALLYLVWSLRIREWNLVVINAGLLLVYILGAIIRL